MAASVLGSLLSAGAVTAQAPAPTDTSKREAAAPRAVLAKQKTVYYKRDPIPAEEATVRPAIDNRRAPSFHPELRRVGAQFPAGGQDKQVGEFEIRVQAPGPDRLFQRLSEQQVFERFRREADATGAGRAFFPVEEPITREKFAPRVWPRSVELVEPSFVCHGRLYFEQRNFERYGWDLGILQPAVSVGIFYYDMLTLPYQWGTRPCQRYECSAGKCLPGDPVPLLLYPREWSWTGLAAQAGAVTTGILMFP